MQRALVSSGGGDCLGVSMAAAPSPYICNGDDFLSPYTIFSTIDTAPLPASGSFAISPSSVSFEEAEASSTATEDRLCLARLALRYREITERYGICLSHLCDTAEEVESLRRENASLRTANGELARRLELLAGKHTGRFPSSAGVVLMDELPPPSASPKRRSPETAPRACSPFRRESAVATGRQLGRWRRSMSHHRRSPRTDPGAYFPSILFSYYKLRQAHLGGGSNDGKGERVGGADDEKEGESGGGALELEVFRQGMFKTELCNKWEESGVCPYGEHCRFAHGIAELRPVLRHPRYKTELCRMILFGDACTYGHRCQFRHSLSPSDHQRLRRRP
ncbi:zinc finger CCCH domain-containing protein 9-like [Musa acuminata AAA Group]|uniref:zinc finger CCCH domain-containing protein 9-like n=1 Tax=Musa acuminata AAA Group TaxID=214697 RepID=UPI0031CFA28D